MANLETQIVDSIIVENRRKMLTLGGAALAALLIPKAAHAATTVGDNDILNFALNLEYLEANFYYLAAFGTTIDVANTYSTGAGAATYKIAGTGGAGTAGTVTVKTGGAIACKVPFSTTQVGSYCVETAIEEGKHVGFLQTTLGSAAVVQPAINLDGGATSPSTAAFNTLASAAGIASTFDPFASDANFLVGAYIFEDVGVTAYAGAAPLLSQTATGKAYLGAAAGILAVEAYHAGLVRTSIQFMDPGYTGIAVYTQKVSALRTTLAQASIGNTNVDDYGVQGQTVSLGGVASPATNLVDVSPSSATTFARNTNQVLNIVTGGHAGTTASPISPAKGVFFPAGMNGLIQ